MKFFLSVEKMRKLASVQQIINRQTIVYQVLGFKTVSSLDLSVGDLCVYIETDSVITFGFPGFNCLRNYSKKPDVCIKFRKVRDIESQGIIFPLSIVKEYSEYSGSEMPELVIGTDLTEFFGIKKFEPDTPKTSDMAPFPSFVKKTDEPRFQNVYDLDMPKKYYLTEKIDGSSMTVFYVGQEYGVCSRNQLVTGNNQFILTAQKLKLEEKLKNYGSDIVIQGELFGPKIQGNKLKRKDVTIRWFNVFLCSVKQNLSESMRVIKELELEFVPLLDSNFDITGMTLDDLINSTRRYSTIQPDAQMEGIVFRSLDNPKSGFKIINPEFLLKS